MRSIVVFVFSLLLLASAVNAQIESGVITGILKDSAGAVIPQATIEATNVEAGAVYKAVSSETGQYLLSDLPPGLYKLSVRVPGFKQFSQTGIRVDAARRIVIDIVLEVDTIRETITVSAASPLVILARPQQETVALHTSVSTVDRIQIEKQAAKTVIDALSYIPGAWTETRGRKEKQLFSVRGQRYPYPEYAVDGALFREFYEVPYFLSAEDVERIEILRSSATLLTGISGLAGIIDITPRSYDRRETRWLAEYGSLGTYRVHVSHGQRVGNLSYGLGLGGSHTDGPEERHGAESMLTLFGHTNWKASDSLSLRATLLYAQ